MLGLAGGTVQAQTLGDLISSSTAAFYKFADPTDITIEVKVWGSVQYPGLYEVRQGTRLSTLLTLAGGPVGGSDSRMRRTYTIRVWRPQPNSGVYEAISETRMENEIAMLGDDSFSVFRAECLGSLLVSQGLKRFRLGCDLNDPGPMLGPCALVSKLAARAVLA